MSYRKSHNLKLVYCAKICSKRSDSAIDLVKTNKRQAQATSDKRAEGII